ncbi:signal peptidase I [Chthonomonas calidirosea]|uniref:Signal peptidase I n=1 Tax=Chthonomonas calidirosea (strain DSM 23976 / ICMP 18418 / T49) TaxID=1303518 RepID=S0EVJ1_CHTCT|nr:signal peptidase I [Chthonomonas calidirosea]CCW35814.1 signal peptidase I, bacterial type [Chthonomonas calidirosea T49]CEK19166.1 signal peptidase I [Chthonomonas calidirosea]
MSPSTRRQVVFVAVFLVIVLFFMLTFRLSIVDGDSMLPTYHSGQIVLVWRRGPFCPPLRRNEVVLVRQAREVIIKRIARLPGEPLGHSFPDLQALAFRNGLADYYEQHIVQTSHGPQVELTVPKGYIVVLGDNLAVSEDSRVFGPVPEKDVLGVVVNSPPPPYTSIRP